MSVNKPTSRWQNLFRRSLGLIRWKLIKGAVTNRQHICSGTGLMLENSADLAARTFESFVYSIVKITRSYEYQTDDAFTRGAKGVGFYFLDSFSNADWLGRQTPIVWKESSGLPYGLWYHTIWAGEITNSSFHALHCMSWLSVSRNLRGEAQEQFWLRGKSPGMGNELHERKGTIHNMMPIKFGIPQGLVLGPTLFVLFTNDLPSKVTEGTVYMYADDTTLFCIGRTVDEVIKSLNLALHELYTWCIIYKLTPHPKKSEALLNSRTSFVGPLFSVSLGKSTIKWVTQTRLLGITVDNKLSWSAHM